MKHFSLPSVWSVLCILPVLLSSSPTLAEPGMSGNYMGFGVGNNPSNLVDDFLRNQFGDITIDTVQTLTGINLSNPQPHSTPGTSFNGRYDLPNNNLSVRGAAFLGTETRVIEPSVSYDFPVAEQTNVYVGGGFTFVEGKKTGTPLGETSSPVITAGVESAVFGDFVIYGNARFRLNHGNSNTSPLRMQVGGGYRF